MHRNHGSNVGLFSLVHGDFLAERSYVVQRCRKLGGRFYLLCTILSVML